MEMPKIEKGVPVPRPTTTRLALLRQMEIGDSVLIPDMMLPKNARASVCLSAHEAFGKGCYTTAKEDGGIRVWRTG